jgi:hypothetical protein
MELKEIRQAYREILEAYNSRFPLHPQTRAGGEDISEPFGKEEISFQLEFERTKEIRAKLKEAADRSGNAQVWERGKSLDGLDQGLRERVDKALNFGI